MQNAPPHQKPTSRQPMRNSQTPPRNEPKPAKTAAPKNSLTPLSDGLKKDETRPCKTHLHTKNQPLRSRCETAKHHLETSPNQPKPQRQKNSLTPLSDGLKKDEPRPCKNAPPHQKPTSRQPMRNSQTPPRNEPKPAKTAAPKNSLTPLSDGLQKDEPRPCKTHLHTKNLPLRSRCETAKHHLETSPNQPNPQRQKTL